MGFKLPRAVKDCFRLMDDRGGDVPKLKTQFDKYYLAIMVGLERRTLAPEDELNDAEYVDVDEYPREYRDKAGLIAGLLIEAEMARRGIKSEDRESIRKLMVDLLDPQRPTNLSPDGQKFLDLYAAGGISIIQDHIPRTDNLDDFLLLYYQLIDHVQDEDTSCQSGSQEGS